MDHIKTQTTEETYEDRPNLANLKENDFQTTHPECHKTLPKLIKNTVDLPLHVETFRTHELSLGTMKSRLGS